MRAAIELFGSEWCSPCGTAKEIIKSSDPASHGVTYQYIDVGEDPAYAMKALPVIFIGDEKLEGPTESQLRDALSRLYAAVARDREPEPPEPEPEPYEPDIEPPGPTPQPPPDQPQQPTSPSPMPKLVIAGVFAVLGFVAYETLYGD